MKLILDDFIKSVNLNDNFRIDKSFEFNIEYNETYSEDELINFLKEIDN